MIYLGADYAGYRLKEVIAKYLVAKKVRFHDLGCYSVKQKNDFPDFAWPVAKKVSRSKNYLGILICGTGFGMCIAANRFNHVRATLVNDLKQARYSKTHDNSNVLCLSAWSTSSAKALKIVDVWLKTPFQKLPRRIRRFKKIDQWPT